MYGHSYLIIADKCLSLSKITQSYSILLEIIENENFLHEEFVNMIVKFKLHMTEIYKLAYKIKQHLKTLIYSYMVKLFPYANKSC